MTIKQKVFSVFALSIILIITSLAAAKIALDKDAEQLAASQNRYLSTLIAEEFINSSRNLTRLARTFVATGDKKYLDQYWHIVNWRGGKVARPDDFNKELYPGKVKPQIDIMRELNFTEEELGLLKRAGDFSNALINTEDQAMKSREQSKWVDGPFKMNASESVNQFSLRILFDDNYHGEVAKIMGPVGQFITAMENRTEQRLEQAKQSAELWTSISTTLQLGVAFALILLVMITYRYVLVPLTAAVKAMQEIGDGDGDLARRLEVKGKDELSDLALAFNHFVSNIMAVIKQVDTSVNQLSTSSSELAKTAEETDRTTIEQKSSIDQVSTSSSQMVASIQEIAENATSAAETANQSDLETNRSMAVLQDNIGAIRQLTAEIDAASTAIKQLETDSNTITSVLDVIRDIADQTNLLALNAAIEAARAGEQGRGFAVVADEVRNLAQRTQDSTQEIQGMIERLQSSAVQAVKVMEKSTDQVSSCVAGAESAGESLHAITQHISSINDMNNQIAAASEQQGASMAEINHNILSVLARVEDSVQVARETATNGEAMQRLAQELKQQIGAFKVS